MVHFIILKFNYLVYCTPDRNDLNDYLTLYLVKYNMAVRNPSV